MMATDLAGFSALMLESEEASLEVRRRMRSVLRPIVERHGHWYEETGDGTLSWFESALDAVRCALAIQQAVHGDPDLTIKIGIDLGDVLFDEDRLHGLAVASAISIGNRTEPGGLCVSESAFNQLHGRIDVEVDDLGPVQLRVFPRPIRLYRIRTGNEVDVEVDDPPSERRLAAILHADVVSYSHMMATQEDWTVPCDHGVSRGG